MIIKKNLLKEFIRKVHLNGMINKCVFNFKEDGLEVQMTNSNNVIALIGFIKKELIEDYEELGRLSIANLDRLMANIGYMGDTIQIDGEKAIDEKDINRLIFKTKDKNDRWYQPISYSENEESSTDIRKAQSSIVTEEDFTMGVEFLKNAVAIKNSNKKEILHLELVGKEATFYIASSLEEIKSNDSEMREYSNEIDKKLENKYAINYNMYFDKIVEVIEKDSVFNVSTNENVPTVIKNIENDLDFTYIIMPCEF